MKEKDLPSKQKLNQTRVSSDYLDSSYQASILVNNTIIENNAPLHSHYLFHNQQNTYSSSLRLLNPHHSSPKKAKIIQSISKLNKKPAFGCSEIRKIQIFQGKQNKPGPAQYNPDLKNILHRTFIREKTKTQQKETILGSKQNRVVNNLVPIIKMPYQTTKTKLGFGVSSELSRIQSLDSFMRRGNPGPGQYNINQKNITDANKTQRIKMPLHQNNSNIDKQNKNVMASREKDPGPGSYDLPTFTSQKQQFFAKEKWKQKFIQRKVKTKQFLEKLHLQRHENKIRFQEEKIKTKNLNRYSQIQQTTHDNESKAKSLDLARKIGKHTYLRNELRDLTCKYLPKNEEVVFDQHQNRGPTYKHLFSSSFVPKNDHAFQAHYYKPPEKKGEYLFFKARYDCLKPQTQNSCFKSTTARCQF